jgi:hypothetical protein
VKFIAITKDRDAKPFTSATREVVTGFEDVTYPSVEEAAKTRHGREFLRECKNIEPRIDAIDGHAYLHGEVDRDVWAVDVPDLATLVALMAENREYVLCHDTMLKDIDLVIMHEWFWAS